MQRIRKHLTFSNGVALLALFIALGGVTYAAAKLPKNSVGAKQIKRNAVRSKHVKNHSLLKKDFKAGQLPRGAKGNKGDKGDKGDAGPRGTAAGYASVQADGTLLPKVPPTNPDFPSQAFNVTQADITKPAAGTYCFKGLPFKPSSALVSSNNAGASTAATNNVVVSVAVERGNGLNGCAAGSQARVVATQWSDTVAPTNVDKGFIVWFEQAP